MLRAFYDVAGRFIRRLRDATRECSSRLRRTLLIYVNGLAVIEAKATSTVYVSCGVAMSKTGTTNCQGKASMSIVREVKSSSVNTVA
jgi:hypothetical protein